MISPDGLFVARAIVFDHRAKTSTATGRSAKNPGFHWPVVHAFPGGERGGSHQAESAPAVTFEKGGKAAPV